MAFVLDASVAAAWFLPDEARAAADAILMRLNADQAMVPTLFRHELRNIFLMAERRGRLSTVQVDAAQSLLEAMNLDEKTAVAESEIIALARKHRLSGYDAAYLALAVSENLPLASFDRALRSAAAAEGIELLPTDA